MLRAAVLLAAASLSACGGLKALDAAPAAGVNLAGTWKLNRQVSDNPQAMLERIQQNEMRQMRRRGYGDPDNPFDDDMDDGIDDGTPSSQRGRTADGRRPGSGGSRLPSEQSSTQRSNGGGPPGGLLRRSSYAKALGGQLNIDVLTIEQTPTRMSFAGTDWRRNFTPGALSVVSVPDGVADQTSGWVGKEYVIEVRPQVGPRMIERYGLSADSRQLVEKITLTEEGLPKLEFTRVYEPGVSTPRGAPTSN